MEAKKLCRLFSQSALQLGALVSATPCLFELCVSVSSEACVGSLDSATPCLVVQASCLRSNQRVSQLCSQRFSLVRSVVQASCLSSLSRAPTCVSSKRSVVRCVRSVVQASCFLPLYLGLLHALVQRGKCSENFFLFLLCFLFFCLVLEVRQSWRCRITAGSLY